jgi:HK97 family phage prohead protease
MPDIEKENQIGAAQFFAVCSDMRFRQVEGTGEIEIEGYASVEFDDNGERVVDRQGTVISSASARKAIEKALTVYRRNPILLAFHDQTRPVGRVTSIIVDAKGIRINAVLSMSDDCRDIRTKVTEGILKGFSIGFRIPEDAIDEEKDGSYTIREIDLLEISIVSVPANPETLFSVVRRMYEDRESNKTNKEESNTVTKIELTQEEYQALIRQNADMSTQVSIYKDEIKKMTEKAATATGDAKKAYDEAVSKLTAMLDESTKKLSALEIQVKEIKDRPDVQIRSGECQRQTSTGSSDSKSTEKMNRLSHLIERRNYANLEAEYISHKVRNDKLDSFDYSAKDVLEYHAKKCDIPEQELGFKEVFVKGKTTKDFSGTVLVCEKPEVSDLYAKLCAKERQRDIKLEKRAITSSSGIINGPTYEYTPIEMSDLPRPLLGMIPVKNEPSKLHYWYQRTAANTLNWEAEGFTPTSSDSTYTSKSATMKIAYCSGKVNDFADAVGNNPSNFANEVESNSRAVDRGMEWAAIHGDSGADSYSIDGLHYHLRNNSNQVHDGSGTVMTLDNWDTVLYRFKELAGTHDEDEIKPSFIGTCTRGFHKLRCLLRDKAYNYEIGMVNVGGVIYRSLVYGGVPVLELFDLRDWSTAAPSFTSTASGSGYTLTADTYLTQVSAVTKNGETTASSEDTQAVSSGEKLTITITQRTADLYYKIYITVSTTGTETLAKVVANDGNSTQDVVFDADADILTAYEVPKNIKEVEILAAALGGNSGYEFGYAANKRFVRLGKAGDFEQFYFVNYVHAAMKNQYAVVCDISDYTA